MSIRRSGLVKPVVLLCVKELNDPVFKLRSGEKCELILDLGAMYMVKSESGQEAVVSKDSFVVVKEAE